MRKTLSKTDRRREKLLTDFVAATADQLIDTTGSWGVQSPDLGNLYLRHLTGDDELMIVGCAIEWQSPHPVLETIATWTPNPDRLTGKAAAAMHGAAPERGDVLVFGDRACDHYGTLGVYLEHTHTTLGVEWRMWSQSPGPVREFKIADVHMPVLGWWHVNDELLRGKRTQSYVAAMIDERVA